MMKNQFFVYACMPNSVPLHIIVNIEERWESHFNNNALKKTYNLFTCLNKNLIESHIECKKPEQMCSYIPNHFYWVLDNRTRHYEQYHITNKGDEKVQWTFNRNSIIII